MRPFQPEMIRTCHRCSTIARLRGGDWDFNLALGLNWGKAAKAASKTNTLQPFVKALQKIGGQHARDV